MAASSNSVPVRFGPSRKKAVAAEIKEQTTMPDIPNRKTKTVGVNSLIKLLAYKDDHWKLNATKDEHYSEETAASLGQKIDRLHNALSLSIGWMMANFSPIRDDSFKYTVSREYTVIDRKHKMIVNNKAGFLRGDLDFVVKHRTSKRLCVVDIKTTELNQTGLNEKEWLEAAVMKRKNVLQLRVYAVLARRKFGLSYTPDCYVLGVHVGATTKGFAVWKLASTVSAVDLESALSVWPQDYRRLSPNDFADT